MLAESLVSLLAVSVLVSSLRLRVCHEQSPVIISKLRELGRHSFGVRSGICLIFAGLADTNLHSQRHS